MGRPKKLTREVKTAIRKILNRHPNWSIRDIEKKIPDFLDPKLYNAEERKRMSPGRTLIAGYVSEIRKTKADPLNRPWHILDLTQDQAQALPLILKAQKYFSQASPDHESRQLTIREAKWISRLSSIYDYDIERTRIMRDRESVLADKGRRLTILFNLAEKCAWHEEFNESESTRDEGMESMIEQNLYHEFTGKGPLEPVTKDGKEVEPEIVRLTREAYRTNSKAEGGTP